MSIYGYLNCHDCRIYLWLGAACSGGFHIGPAETPPHWERPMLNRVLWKFLADHCRHRIDVRLEHDMETAMFDYLSVNDDPEGDDIGFDEYLAGTWREPSPPAS